VLRIFVSRFIALPTKADIPKEKHKAKGFYGSFQENVRMLMKVSKRTVEGMALNGT
jgi:hypothetical protein